MAGTNQGNRQASARAIHGLGAGRTYNGDLYAMAVAEASVPAGTTLNGALLIWANTRLSASHTNVTDALNAFAVDLGFRAWHEVGLFNPAP